MTEPAPSAGSAGGQAREEPWGDPPRRHPYAAPILSVAGFEGPLDWLLEMARARKIDLAKLSILALVEAFAAALDSAISLSRPGEGRSSPAADLSRWGDWLVMAASLTLLRSRLLLPPDTPQGRAAQDEAEALRRQLVHRAEIEAAVRWLDGRPQLGRDVFARGRPEPVATQRAGDITALFRACLVVLRVPEQTGIDQPKPPPLWRVADALARITRLIAERPEGGLIETFWPTVIPRGLDHDLRCRAAVASTFVAGLELARNQMLALEQDLPFGPVAVRPLPQPCL